MAEDVFRIVLPGRLEHPLRELAARRRASSPTALVREVMESELRGAGIAFDEEPPVVEPSQGGAA